MSPCSNAWPAVSQPRSLIECCTEYCSPTSTLASYTKLADIHLGALIVLRGVWTPNPRHDYVPEQNCNIIAHLPVRNVICPSINSHSSSTMFDVPCCFWKTHSISCRLQNWGMVCWETTRLMWSPESCNMLQQLSALVHAWCAGKSKSPQLDRCLAATVWAARHSGGSIGWVGDGGDRPLEWSLKSFFAICGNQFSQSSYSRVL